MNTSEWSANINGKLVTDLSLADIRAKVASGEIGKSTLITSTGRAGFIAAEKAPELWSVPESSAALPTPSIPVTAPPVEAKGGTRMYIRLGVIGVLFFLIFGCIGFFVYARQSSPAESVAYWHRHMSSVQKYLSQFGIAWDLKTSNDYKDTFAIIAKSKDIMVEAERQLRSDTEQSSTFRVDDELVTLTRKESSTLTLLVDNLYHAVMLQREPNQKEKDDFAKTISEFFVERARVRSSVKNRLGIEIE